MYIKMFEQIIRIHRLQKKKKMRADSQYTCLAAVNFEYIIPRTKHGQA